MFLDADYTHSRGMSGSPCPRCVSRAVRDTRHPLTRGTSPLFYSILVFRCKEDHLQSFAECVIVCRCASLFSFQPCCVVIPHTRCNVFSMMALYKTFLWQINESSVCSTEARDDLMRRKTLKCCVIPNTYHSHKKLAPDNRGCKVLRTDVTRTFMEYF